MTNPLKKMVVTGGFRTRNRPNHNATDYRAAVGTNVYASMDGTVHTGSGHRLAGTWIEIRSGRNMVGYNHLSSRSVKAGQKVKRGDLIGKTGNTGRTTGPHLHFYVEVNGRRVNPVTWLAAQNKPKPKPSNSGGGRTTSSYLTRAQITKLQRGLRTNFPAYKWKVKVKRGQLIAVDGFDGPQTQAWVKEFQRRTGLTVDGIVGPLTIAKLAQYGIRL